MTKSLQFEFVSFHEKFNLIKNVRRIKGGKSQTDAYS